jgi:para-aminobenzoate synthetase/4-amino-4-deoxychorismate lyase
VTSRPPRPAPANAWFESYRPGAEGRSFRFSDPFASAEAITLAEVVPLLQRVQEAVASGLHAVLFLGYEAAPAFDSALVAHVARGPLPLAWAGFYRRRDPVETGVAPDAGSADLTPWDPAWDEGRHAVAVAAVRRWIGAGDVYQVNLTHPLGASFHGDPAALYRDLCRRQGDAAFCAYLGWDDVALLSVSPELFIAIGPGGHLRTRPMKGTRPRGETPEADEALRTELQGSDKERAENLMIVDLLRNDLGRVALPGTVHTSDLWRTEAYDTVWQMTSTVTARARPDIGLAELFAALFPCGSVTGAPKVRAMEIIRDLEEGPRGLYTGSVGFLSPAATSGAGALAGMEGVFNVAIRSVVVDRVAGRAHAGVGGGITWDSEAAAEYRECRHKAAFLGDLRGEGDFELFETLLFAPGEGYYLVERHLERLGRSAAQLGFHWDEEAARRSLLSAVADAGESLAVRLTLDRGGALATESRALDSTGGSWTAIIASSPVDSRSDGLRHKTTRRAVYVRARAEAERAGAQEAILRNERGELTECCIGNLVVERQGRRLTPPLSCGLLPGTFRADLLATGQLEEGVLREEDLHDADGIYMINSVRRWVRLMVIPRDDRASSTSGLTGTARKDTSCTG